jgi:hypothetical protein
MWLKRLIAVSGLALILGLGPAVVAQESEPAEQATDEPSTTDAPAEPAEKQTGEDDVPAVPADAPQVPEKKSYFGLYVLAAGGTATADDLNSSLMTISTSTSENVLTMEDQIYSRVAFGWKLQNGKGDFRLVGDYYKEDGYSFTALGRQASLDPDLGLGASTIPPFNALWWTSTIENGVLTAVRTPPQWDLDSDVNDNGLIDRGEIFYIGADLTPAPKAVTNDLQNRITSWDALYGRTFGRRRYSARWWAGLRYFEYKGNVPAGAWLSFGEPGEGFTDGYNLTLMNLSQKTTSFGPTGSLEADFNFFDKKLVFYLRGQAAFMMSSLETDSGAFITQISSTDGSVIFNAPANINSQVDKSTWQDAFEAGARINLKMGLGITLAYQIQGYLDTVLLPSSIQIPQNQQEIAQGTSALFNTQDLVLDGWYAGLSFQF